MLVVSLECIEFVFRISIASVGSVRTGGDAGMGRSFSRVWGSFHLEFIQSERAICLDGRICLALRLNDKMTALSLPA